MPPPPPPHRHQTWKILKGVVWFLSLIWWQILLGIFFSTLAYEKNHLMNVRHVCVCVNVCMAA